MSPRNQRSGRALRVILAIVAVAITIPLAVIGVSLIGYREAALNAQDVIRVQRERAHNALERVNDSFESKVPTIEERDVEGIAGRTVERELKTTELRPVNETVYETQVVERIIPVVDPKTGKTTFRKEARAVKVPRTETRWVKQQRSNSHDSRTQQLIAEVRELDEDAPSRASKLEELRKQLETEFQQMHQRQSEQIEETENRLAKLRVLHEKRTEHKDEIVQRRINELLGDADPLQWNVGNVSPPQPFPTLFRSESELPAAPPSRFPPPPSLPPLHDFPGRPSTRVNPAPNFAPRSVEIEETFTQPDTYADVSRNPNFDRAVVIENQAPYPIPTPPSLPTPPRSPDFPTQPDAVPSENPVSNIDEAETSRLPGKADNASADFTAVNGVANQSFGRLFQVVQAKAIAEAELAAAEREFERLNELEYEDKAADKELKQATLTREKLRYETAIRKMELEAISAQLRRDLDLAKATLEHAARNRDLIESRYGTGTETTDKVIHAEFEVTKAEQTLLTAEARLEQLNMALEAIEKLNQSNNLPLESEL